MDKLPDVQNKPAEIQIPLSKVGVENVEKYIQINRESGSFNLTAKLNMYVELDSKHKGVNMSRFLDTINDVNPNTSSIEDYAREVAEENKKRHDGAESFVEIWSKFPYPIKRPDGEVEIRMWPLYTSYRTNAEAYVVLIKAVGMSYCPCGKEMCGGPSHNQRSVAEITLHLPKGTHISGGELVDIANSSFSAPIFSSLKRPWEKHMIESAMKNAKFSEDTCREIVERLIRNYAGVAYWAKVKVINEESIHPHDCVSIWEGEL